jgi:cation diffusion facilitator CzcD-associated flavoprotein CzcO
VEKVDFCSYAPAGEILEYFQRVSRENGLYEFMKFGHRVVSAIWDEDTGRWNLEIMVEDEIIKDWCHVLINGSGGLKYISPSLSPPTHFRDQAGLMIVRGYGLKSLVCAISRGS